MSAPVELVLVRNGVQEGLIHGHADARSSAGIPRGIVSVEGRYLATKALDPDSPAELHRVEDGRLFADKVWVASHGEASALENGTYLYERIVFHGAVPLFEVHGYE